MEKYSLAITFVIWLLVIGVCIYRMLRARRPRIVNEVLPEPRIDVLRKYAEYDLSRKEYDYVYTFQLGNEVPELLERYHYTEYVKGIAPGSDDMAFALLNFVCEHFGHDGNAHLPQERRMVDIIAGCEQNGQKTNCRGLSIILAELLRMNGIKARHVTCKPFEEPFGDCHVVVDCLLPSGQRVMLDPTMRLFLKDANGEYVSIERFRKGLIAGETFFENQEASYNGGDFDKDNYLTYMAKNLFRFSVCVNNADVKRENEQTELELIPGDYPTDKFPKWKQKKFVYDPVRFWSLEY